MLLPKSQVYEEENVHKFIVIMAGTFTELSEYFARGTN